MMCNRYTLTSEQLERYMVLRKEGLMGRLWYDTQSNESPYAPPTAPKMLEHHHAELVSHSLIGELIDKLWQQRQLRLPL